MVEPDAVERREPAARRRDLEDAEPSALAEHAPQLADARFEVLDVAHAEADGGGVERRRRRTAARARRPARTRSRAPSAARARASRSEKSRPTTSAPCARAPIARSPVPQHASSVRSSRANGLLDRDAPPAPVETRRHHVVHHVVHRRDAVEHPAHAVGRQRSASRRRRRSLTPPLRERVLEPELVERAADDEVDEVVDRLGSVVEARREEEDRRARLAQREHVAQVDRPRAASRAA